MNTRRSFLSKIAQVVGVCVLVRLDAAPIAELVKEKATEIIFVMNPEWVNASFQIGIEGTYTSLVKTKRLDIEPLLPRYASDEDARHDRNRIYPYMAKEVDKIALDIS